MGLGLALVTILLSWGSISACWAHSSPCAYDLPCKRLIDPAVVAFDGCHEGFLSSPPLCSRLGEVASALAATDPAPQRVVLFGSGHNGKH
jgi:hypothetical protein